MLKYDWVIIVGKFSKMLYMIDLLNSGNKYSVPELAQKVGVTERMIRYYKEELESDGIFIESFKGPNGGYFLINKIRNYINFNKYDVELLECSYEFLKNAKFQFSEKYLNLIYKAKCMFNISEEKSKFISSIRIEDTDELLKIINASINKSDSINISYLNIDGTIINRNIHPLQLFIYNDVNYVTAYCELRNDIRHFEINRIKNIN